MQRLHIFLFLMISAPPSFRKPFDGREIHQRQRSYPFAFPVQEGKIFLPGNLPVFLFCGAEDELSLI